MLQGAGGYKYSRKHERDPHQCQFEIRRRGELRVASFAIPGRGPCRVPGTVEQILPRHRPGAARGRANCADRIEVVKVNADDNPNLSLWFGVPHIPTLLYFEAGKLRGQLVGTVSKDAILNLLSRNS